MSIADLATTCFAVQLLVGAILLIGEASGRLRLPYGKFRTGEAPVIGQPIIFTCSTERHCQLSVFGFNPLQLFLGLDALS